MKKKIIVGLLCAVMLLSMAGCSLLFGKKIILTDINDYGNYFLYVGYGSKDFFPNLEEIEEYKKEKKVSINFEKVDTLDKTKGWITLDRLHFETGSSNLTADSEDQLKNIAMILKFFPNSQIKVGGYTDNTGTDEINMKLSAERAKVTADKLVSLGIDPSRVASEGYGSQHPVCQANDTDYCKALNRRIDVRVTQK
jgi:outer membrane protein OmpA-like peptidoglycan-associated protein